MTFRRRILDVPVNCSRCIDLGLPPGGIAPHEPHWVFVGEDHVAACCQDCWDRLQEELMCGEQE